MQQRTLAILLIVLLSVAIVLVSAFVGLEYLQGSATATPTPETQGHHKHKPTPTSNVSLTPVATGMPHTQGTQIIDASGHPLILRGAQMESPFNYLSTWESGRRPSATLNSRTFHVMVSDWKMNVVRIPLSNWIYAKYSADYISQLDQVVQEAN